MELSITLIIIIVTCLVSIGGFSNHKIIDDLIFYPPAITKQKQWYRFITCGLIHADTGHLIWNMFALYIFGIGRVKTQFGYINTGVEYQFIELFGEKGKFIYLAMYVLALAACLIPTFSKNKENYYYRSLGASGAVSAVIFASILFHPLMGMGLFFIPVYIAGFLFGLIYIIISSWMDKRGKDNVNHSAHIFGAVFGIVFTIVVCKYFANFPIWQQFIEQIKNMDLKQIIQFGS
jgi:membrane associated rhomboid family serine protease